MIFGRKIQQLCNFDFKKFQSKLATLKKIIVKVADKLQEILSTF